MPETKARPETRATPTTTDCLYTTVMNTSGMEAVFSFLPPHGKRMLPNEQLTVAGNIIDRLAVKTSKRQFQALERALQSGALVIISTPGQYVADDTKSPPELLGMIGNDGGVLGLVDPCWNPT